MGGREGCDGNYEVDPVQMAWNGCIIEEEEEERLLWQINNNTMLYMISFAKETPIKTCNMSLAREPPYYNDIIILI